jgi:hypothetical protein
MIDKNSKDLLRDYFSKGTVGESHLSVSGLSEKM